MNKVSLIVCLALTNTLVAMNDSSQLDTVSIKDEVNTALHDAAWFGHTAPLELLIKEGALVDALDDKGRTALHCASLQGDKAAIELLLANGANLNAANEEGDTPLHLAAQKWNVTVAYYEAIKLLLEKGADVNAVNYKGDTPLICVSYNMLINNDIALVRKIADLLLGYGAHVTAINQEGNTCLHILMSNRKHRIIEEIDPLLRAATLEYFQERYQSSYNRIFCCFCLFARLEKVYQCSLPPAIQKKIIASVFELRCDVLLGIKDKRLMSKKAQTLLSWADGNVTLMECIAQALYSFLSKKNNEQQMAYERLFPACGLSDYANPKNRFRLVLKIKALCDFDFALSK